MIMTVMIVGLALTVFVLVLTLVTISKGYSYKHTIDPLEKDDGNKEIGHRESNLK